VLASAFSHSHIDEMSTKPSTARRSRRLSPDERTVIYHGIKIPPMLGKRSPTAEALRAALQELSESTRGDSDPR